MRGRGIIGAIVGDIVGSIYERKGFRTKDFNFEMFKGGSKPTDDTVMSLAVAEWLMGGPKEENGSLVNCMQRIGTDPDLGIVGYGGMFRKWLMEKNPKPYGSYGNGAPMRVSPVGWFTCITDKGALLARQTAEVSHNAEEAVRSAILVARLIILCRQSKTLSEAKEIILRESKECFPEFDFRQTPEDIRPNYSFKVRCNECVPECMVCIIHSNSYEEAIRNAVSLGGDADTMACIAGSIACACPGMEVPGWMEIKALQYLHPHLRDIYERWEDFLVKNNI